MSTEVEIVSVNVNGIRAATKQRSEENLGMLAWLENTTADIVCLQEVRATDAQAVKALQPALDSGWHWVGAEAAAKGRSGVGFLSRTPAQDVTVGFGDEEFAESGRYIQAQFQVESTPVTVASLYLPSGEAETDKQVEKERFLASFRQYLAQQASINTATGRAMVVCGDWNIAHGENDLKNHKGNHKTSGFLPHEREWMTDVFADGSGWTDIVRELTGDTPGPYSWWSYRGKAFDNDAGWRIDYQVVSDELAKVARETRVDRAERYDLRWSDHAPVVVRYGWDD